VHVKAFSYLVVPADRPERFAKAQLSGAHIVIIDLEDAVAPEAKDAAREAVARYLSPDHPVALRINGTASAWFKDDLALCSHPGVCAVVLPKAESAQELQALAAYAPGKALLPMIETAQGFEAMRAIAPAAAGGRLLFGSSDFQLDLQIASDDEALLYFRSRMVLVSRLAGLPPPVDGVCVAIGDQQRLAAEVARARKLGFGGKLCIHPQQVSTVNELFRPSQAELEWSRRVIEASERAKGAPFAVDGKMVDRPVLLLAQRIREQGTEEH
jgi:citrate lyase subunit beta/citryl-CoA lyase